MLAPNSVENLDVSGPFVPFNLKVLIAALITAAIVYYPVLWLMDRLGDIIIWLRRRL